LTIEAAQAIVNGHIEFKEVKGEKEKVLDIIFYFLLMFWMKEEVIEKWLQTEELKKLITNIDGTAKKMVSFLFFYFLCVVDGI